MDDFTSTLQEHREQIRAISPLIIANTPEILESGNVDSNDFLKLFTTPFSTVKDLLFPQRLFDDRNKLGICPLQNKYVLSGLSLGILLHCMPFEWDSKRKKVIVSDSRSRKIGWTVATTVQILLCVRFFKRAVQYWQIRLASNSNMLKFVESSSSCAQFSVITTISLALMWSPEDFIRTIYAMDSLNEKAEEGSSSNKRKKWSGVGKLITAFHYYTITVVLLFSIGLVINEDNHILMITKKRMEAGNIRTILMIFQWIILVYTRAAVGSYANALTFPFIVYYSDAVTHLKELNSNNKITTFRESRKQLSIYRRLYLKFQAWNQFTAPLIFPCYRALVVAGLVVVYYGIVRLRGWTKCIAGALALYHTITALLMFLSLAKINSLSQEFISWRKAAGYSKAEMKVTKSLLPFRVHVDPFGYVDTAMVLSMLSVIIDSTVSMLVLDTE